MNSLGGIKMAVSEQTRRVVWGMFAGRCGICRSSLIVDSKDAHKRKILVGQVAHMVGEREAAARGISSMSLDEKIHQTI
jgi:hypothetical protein